MRLMNEQSHRWGDELPSYRRIVTVLTAVVLLVAAGGLVSSFQERNTETPTATVDADTSNDVRVAVLGGEEVLLEDGSALQTLVETPDIGLLEVGVQVSGPAAATYRDGEIYLRSSTGRVFTPSGTNADGDVRSFTINAALDGETVALLWVRDGRTVVELR